MRHSGIDPGVGVRLTTEGVIAEIIRNSNDTERTTQATSYTKKKEILLNEPIQDCCVDLDFKSSDAAYTAYAYLYKNGSAHAGGVEWSTNGTSYATVQAILGTNLGVKNDLIQIYAKISNALGTISMRNFRFRYTIKVARSTTNQDP